MASNLQRRLDALEQRQPRRDGLSFAVVADLQSWARAGHPEPQPGSKPGVIYAAKTELRAWAEAQRQAIKEIKAYEPIDY
jgi:hypothetical protein